MRAYWLNRWADQLSHRGLQTSIIYIHVLQATCAVVSPLDILYISLHQTALTQSAAA